MRLTTNELGVDRSARRLPHARGAHGRVVAGVKLDSQYGYDIDAAAAYARRAGLRYVEVRETTFGSGPPATAWISFGAGLRPLPGDRTPQPQPYLLAKSESTRRDKEEVMGAIPPLT